MKPNFDKIGRKDGCSSAEIHPEETVCGAAFHASSPKPVGETLPRGGLSARARHSDAPESSPCLDRDRPHRGADSAGDARHPVDASGPRLLDRLTRYCASDALPMHMPGHKRNPAALSLPAPVPIDITEIDGFDNLHGAEELLLSCQQRAARVFGAEETHFLVNGSTGGILSAITACVSRGETLLLSRNAHKSALNAVTLGGIRPRYLYPDFLPESGISGAIPPEQVEQALTSDPAIRCAFITSPTYEGVISDIAAIADICHRHGAILIVDEAHGAHLGFGKFPPGAIRLGADVVIQSVHKTLGSLTQTALLHISGPRVNRERLRRMLTVYQTSSPSYILMASIDECVCRMEAQGDALAGRWLDAIAGFRTAVRGLKRLRLLPVEDVRCDPSKITISTRGTHIGGPELQRILRDRHHIELEMAAGHYAIAMTGIGDTRESLQRLADALQTIDGELQAAPMTAPVDPLSPRPEMRLTPAEADALPAEAVPVSEAAGRICAETVFAYPPGIPLIVPGETVNGDLLRRLLDERTRGVALTSSSGDLPSSIRVIRHT